MSAPTVTGSQLTPLLERLLQRADEEGNAAPLVLIRGDLDTALGSSIAVDSRTVDLVASSSPLEIRAAAAKERKRPLAVVTPCDTPALGLDLVARSLRRRVHPVDRWTTVTQLFRAEQPSKALARHGGLADVLIEEAAAGHTFPPSTARVLDYDTAISALSRALIGRPLDSLHDLVLWAETPEAAGAFRRLRRRDTVLRLLQQHHVDTLGPGAAVVHAALRHGLDTPITGAALAAHALFANPDPHPAAYQNVDQTFGGEGLEADAYRDLGRTAVQRALDLAGGPEVHRWIESGDRLLAQWGSQSEAWRSPVLRTGYHQRLQRVANALARWRDQPTDADLAQEADDAIEHVAAHRETIIAVDPRRVERLRMAARMIRRNGFALEQPETLAAALRSYRRDGAWLDRAREFLAQGDELPELHDLYRALTEEADQARDTQAKDLGQVLSLAAHPLSDGVIGIESVLDQVLVPVAQATPVLFVVLDGMGWPSFLDVNHHLEQSGWVPMRDTAGNVDQSVVAVLPTVTEFSRTSLFTGALETGNAATERRRFLAHPGLVGVSQKNHPPEIHHKGDLKIDGSIDAVPKSVTEAIEDVRKRVVAVVINNIDERLKEVANPLSGWDLAALTPLGTLLNSARHVGRAVVVTADHGHVLERNTDRQPGPGGERWRVSGENPPAADEIEVAGPRVLSPDHTAVMPVVEQTRYSPARRHGYHGGLTLNEVAIPLAVYSADLHGIDGWEPTAFAPPSWWYSVPPAQSDDLAAPAPAAKPRKKPTSKRNAGPDQAQLFEPGTVPRDQELDTADEKDEAQSVPAGVANTRIARIMAESQIRGQLDLLRLTADTVAEALSQLDRYEGAPVTLERLADQIACPQARIGRLVTQIQRLVNLDGAGVIEVTNGDVRFNRPLLERQLGLD